MKHFFVILIFLLLSYFAFPSIVDVLFNSGLNFYNAGDYDNAIDRLTKVFEEYPESSLFPKSCFYLGLIYYDKGEYNTAKKYLLISIKRAKKGSYLWVNAMKTLGVIYYEEGNNEKYEKVFSELSKFTRGGDIIIEKSVKSVSKVSPEYKKSKDINKNQTTNTKESLIITNFIFFTNYLTNFIYLTNVEGSDLSKIIVYTNYITNFFTNYTYEGTGINSNVITNLTDIKNKVDEINKKEEQLEELNRLTDIKNRLLKLSEKALVIQEMINKKMGVSNQ